MNISFTPASGPRLVAASRCGSALPMLRVNTLVVGGGPAGLAPLVAASRAGTLERILAGGVVVAERGETIGAGRLGSYAIGTDSTAETIVSSVMENNFPPLARLRDHPATLAVAVHGKGPVPLSLVGAFMAVLGEAMLGVLRAAPAGGVLLGHEAVHTRRGEDGLWRTLLRRRTDGARRVVLSPLVLLATGGHQPLARLEQQWAGAAPLLPRHGGRLLQSDEVLTAPGLERLGERLEVRAHPRVVIVGSSSSAMASAGALLRSRFGGRFGPAGITLLHRRPLRVFYHSAAAALADGYDEFGPEDICPISGFVFRFAGFRLESRELLMAARGIGGRTPEPRLRLCRLGMGHDAEAQALLAEADVVVAALGYRPRALAVLGSSGEPLRLQAEGNQGKPLVDAACRVLDAAGRPLPGLLGIGLAAGCAIDGTVGGEPSFAGQTNGLWQWQNQVGDIIAQAVLRQAEAPGAARFAAAIGAAGLAG